jgi:nucleoside 2-deoxyribosyltransferase
VTLAYLAGPEVFLPGAVALGEAKKAICAEHGIEGLFPLDPIGGRSPDPEDGLAIFEHCVAHLERCDVVIANLTPFRGPSADVGTAVEMGYAFGAGKAVFGYTNVATDYCERVDGEPDWVVEDFEFADNLMVEGTVRRHGTVVRTNVSADSAGALLTDLTGFRAAVGEAANSSR